MSGMSAWVTSDTTRWRRALTGSVRKSMAVTPDSPGARDLVSGRASRAPSESPYVAHSAPAPDKPVRLSVSIEKLESLTIHAIAHRDETDRSSSRLAGEHSLIAIRLDVDRPNGERQSVAGGRVFTQIVRPTGTPGRHFARAFYIDGR